MRAVEEEIEIIYSPNFVASQRKGWAVPKAFQKFSHKYFLWFFMFENGRLATGDDLYPNKYKVHENKVIHLDNLFDVKEMINTYLDNYDGTGMKPPVISLVAGRVQQIFPKKLMKLEIVGKHTFEV